MPSTKIDSSELATYSLIGTFYALTEGVVTLQEVLGASRHPRMRILRILVMDMVGTTATNVSVLNGATTMVTAVAANVAAVGNVTNLTLITNTDVVESASSISVTTSGANDKLVWLFEYELTN